jgi:hypothetical protein
MHVYLLVRREDVDQLDVGKQHASAAIPLYSQIVENVSDLEHFTLLQVLFSLLDAGFVFFPHFGYDLATGETSYGYH